MKFISKLFLTALLLFLVSPVKLSQVKKESDHTSMYNYLNNLYSTKRKNLLKNKHIDRASNQLKTELEKKSRFYQVSKDAKDTKDTKEKKDTTEGKEAKDTNKVESVVVDSKLNGKDDKSAEEIIKGVNGTTLMEGWLSISSHDFLVENRFPIINMPNNDYEDVKVDRNKFRINQQATTDLKNPKLDFYFRMNKDHIYYSSAKEDINIMGSIDLLQVKFTERSQIEENCYIVYLKTNSEFKICGKDFNERDIWYCGLAARVGIKDQFCKNNQNNSFKPTFNVERKVYQPIILIPEQSSICNDNFDYNKRGLDWECTCSEGKEQSPIDIKLDKVFESPAIPVFSFDEVEAISPITSLDGTMVSREHIKIRYFKHAIRIFHPSFGKIVTLDGSVYHAEEIVFHSPAEHMINGVRHEMEMQIIAYGQSKGDIAKQVVLSFVFEKKAGVYNKFLDDVDFYNLPNKHNPVKNIVNNLYIPKVLYSHDSEGAAMKPFSLFTYQGSISFPPCTERTINYVAAEPIPVAHSIISLLKEALRERDDQPDYELENIRDIQPLNNRIVYFFDASICKTPDVIVTTQKPGHFEKITDKVTEYFFVEGNEPSKVPDTYVVTEKEAKKIPKMFPLV